MKKLILLVAMLALAGRLWASAANTKVEEPLQNASEVLREVMNAPDKGIPLEIVEHAKCIAVIPHQIKAGFVVAAKFGKGVATCRTEEDGVRRLSSRSQAADGALRSGLRASTTSS